MLRKLALVLLMASSSILFAAQQERDVTIPQNSTIQYLGEHDGMYQFQGKIQLTGMLKARWGKDITGSPPDKKIYFLFLPTEKQLARLPTINDQYKNSQQMISLNSDVSAAINKEIIERHFSSIPASFWKNQEGEIQQSVMVTIDDFKAGDDCDYRYYYAHIASIKVATEADVMPTIPEILGCNSMVFDDIYMIQSEENYTNLRKAANSQSRVIQLLANGMLIKKVKMVGNWYYINVLDAGETTEIYGYIHKSQIVAVN